MDSFREVWGLVCEYCKNKITDVAYKAWIEKIEPVSMDFASCGAVIAAPTEFHRQTLQKCYLALISEAFKEIFESEIKIEVVLRDQETKEKSFLKHAQINSKSSSEGEFTFDNYVVGSSNKFAHAAAMAVAANPAKSYNPLFVYGSSGLGKTHLLYAICNEIKKTEGDLVPVYIKGDDFTNELINAIRTNTTNTFHSKYRKASIFLVDDIQFIAGKDSTQEEFFHTFNSLYEAKRQIVLTSDRPPKEIQTLENRLRTRFEWGLIADIQAPDFETRTAIIKRKAEFLEINLPRDVTEYIARKLRANIRQLEGAVKKLKAYQLLKGQEPSVWIAKEAISDTLNNDQPPLVTVEKIIEETARTFGVLSEDIRSSKRSSSISTARQAAIYICREITQLSTSAIGKKFGGRDHSTVSYAIQQVEKNINSDKNAKAVINDIVKNMQGA
ncbi:MAG: chromosomal replication initiator protein DnaA [Oscillospiraceae bacterium]|nr:chromosomal replication initiator protein DnaA [Oscillospiraceae bacterium]